MLKKVLILSIITLSHYSLSQTNDTINISETLEESTIILEKYEKSLSSKTFREKTYANFVKLFSIHPKTKLKNFKELSLISDEFSKSDQAEIDYFYTDQDKNEISLIINTDFEIYQYNDQISITIENDYPISLDAYLLMNPMPSKAIIESIKIKGDINSDKSLTLNFELQTLNSPSPEVLKKEINSIKKSFFKSFLN